MPGAVGKNRSVPSCAEYILGDSREITMALGFATCLKANAKSGPHPLIINQHWP
jgi:hypothetical protein